eukprot:scaffold5697_cov102-Isochrysis_galbana.AAC.5
MAGTPLDPGRSLGLNRLAGGPLKRSRTSTESEMELRIPRAGPFPFRPGVRLPAGGAGGASSKRRSLEAGGEPAPRPPAPGGSFTEREAPADMCRGKAVRGRTCDVKPGLEKGSVGPTAASCPSCLQGRTRPRVSNRRAQAAFSRARISAIPPRPTCLADGTRSEMLGVRSAGERRTGCASHPLILVWGRCGCSGSAVTAQSRSSGASPGEWTVPDR